MKLNKRLISALSLAALWLGALGVETNPASVQALLNRIGGAGTADKFETVVDESLANGGKETFVITSSGGKPCIKGSTLSALTTGIGWYLNHHANINLTWNQPRADIASVTLPVPAGEETHTTSAEYRYYLNYCTFSYSMSTWTWDRWQEEIDWMALRGINMPLQIIGLEEVWRKFLMNDLGEGKNYTQAEVDAYVAGPCYMAWFGMNNLEGWGGKNPEWWYTRQAQLGKQIGERMRSLGIEPVLPGFCQVPSNFTDKTGILSAGQGNWCGFKRPFMINPADEKFSDCAKKFYARVKEVMGDSKYYSIDPFHEGGGGSLSAQSVYEGYYKAMNDNNPGSQWVIQSWQWSGTQRQSLNYVPVGKLIVLDLFSDGSPNWGSYGNHDVVYSTIFNFGGRTGYFGRAQSVIDGYWNAKTQKATVKGIGAAPEAIEQTPAVYDLLFELPWMSQKPDVKQWFKDYSTRRYGEENDQTAEAWELIRSSALNRQGAGQGPHEALMCARPNLNGNKVSTWGFNELYYDPNALTEAAYKLLEADLEGENYSFDLTDISRQALTDYVRKLIPAMQQANSAGDTELFNKRKEGFLQLMLDIDELLNTNSEFMLGHWTERARNMADEVAGTTLADRDWLELNNARQLITTWGASNQADGGGLRDYSYRQWGGMMKDYYYQRWKTWFDNGMKAPASGWFQWEWNWAHTNPGIYPTEPIGDSHEVAARILPKYLSPFKSAMAGINTYYVPHLITTDVAGKFFDIAKRDTDYEPAFNIGDIKINEFAIDFNKNGLFDDEGEISATGAFGLFPIPADAPVGERKCRITLEDGTVFTFTLSIIEEITEPRTVTVKTSDAAKGSVSIEGSDAQSVTNTEVVSILATPTQKYDFDHWEDADGNDVGNDNPMKYYSKEPAEFTAYFRDNIWGVPEWVGGTFPPADMTTHGQYLISLGVTQGEGEENTFFESKEAPTEHFYYVSNRIKAAPGGGFHFNYQGQGDLRYQFLSAYCDLNADGKFDINTNELLGTKGTYWTEDASVGKGGFDVLLPYDTPIGTTHIRLRFDGAWMDKEVSGSWVTLENHPSGATGAFKPDVPTNRIIYEILLEINDGVEYATNVTVKVNNDAFGTVRSENSTNVYNPGESVILTAFPNAGYRLSHWEDSHGRKLPSEWMNGNMIEFTAFDNADITAIFEPIPVEVDLWKFNLDVDDEGDLFIAGLVESGEPNLDLSGHHCDFSDDIYYIKPDVFAGNTILRSITLPDQPLYEKGELLNKTDVIMGNTDPGTGTTNNQVVTFLKDENGKNYGMPNEANPTPYNYSEPFTLKITGYNNGESFNEYGSVLFAKGGNGLADSYINGWSQFYLRKDGTLDVKWTSATATNFPVNIHGKFEIVVEYLGKNAEYTDNNKVHDTRITVTNSAGEYYSRDFIGHQEMKAINRFATDLPKGMWVQVRITKPDKQVIPGELLMGCRNLMDIHISQDCKYAVEKDGVIYDQTGTNCIAYPEGRILGGAFSLKTGNGINEFTAAPLKNGDAYSNLAVTTTTQTTNWNTLWTIDEDGSLIHYNSGLGLDATGHALSADDAKFTYKLAYDEGDPSISFTDAAGKFITASGLSDEAFSFDFYPLTELTVPGNGDTPRTVTFPVNVIVPDNAEVFSLDKVGSKGGYVSHIMPGHIIPAGTGVLIEGEVSPFVITSEPSSETPDLLDGTNVDLVMNQPYFVLEGENFVLKQSGTVPANTGYVVQRFVSEASFPYRAKGYEPVEIDGWKFDWRESYNENVICLTAAIESGNPSLDLSKEVESGDKIVDIDPVMFQNHTELYEVTLPAQRLAHHYYDSSVEGQGTPGAGNGPYNTLELPQPLTGEKNWRMTIEASTDGSAYNQWGSCLFATGTNPIAPSYNSGFQLYLTKDGKLTVKLNSNDNTSLHTVDISGDFSIVFEYSKANNGNYVLSIKLSCKGKSATLTNNNYKLAKQTHFVAALPQGVNLNKIHFEGEDFSFPYNEGELFMGCTSLQDIHVAEGADYAVEKDGVLYDQTGTNCIAYPEGRLFTRPFVMTCADNVKIGSNPIEEEDGTLSEADVLADATHSDFNALWILGSDKQLTHVNSQAHLNTVGSQLSDQHGQFNYTMDYSLGSEPNIHFTVEDGRKLAHTENFLNLGEETHPFLFTNLTALPAPAEEKVPHVITFPVAVVAGEETSFQGVASIDEEKGATLFKIPAGTIIPAGYAVITLGAESNLPIASAATPALMAADDRENILQGTTNAIRLSKPYYLLEGENFVRHESGTVPANSAYIPAEENNLTAQGFLYDETQSTVINAPTVVQKDVTFDIMGRRVNSTPRHGIYIRNNKKIRL